MTQCFLLKETIDYLTSALDGSAPFDWPGAVDAPSLRIQAFLQMIMDPAGHVIMCHYYQKRKKEEEEGKRDKSCSLGLV